jgi:hypothetical protein
VTAFEKQADAPDRVRVGFVGGESGHARAQAPMNMKLETRLRVVSRKIHVARRNLEESMDEVHQPMREIAREIRAVISRPVLAQPPRHVYPRITLRRQLDVGISFVVAQQNVVARFPLLDQIVLERQCFLLVVDMDVIDFARFADQRSGLRIGQAIVIEITAHTCAQIFGFADIQYGSVGVLVEINAWKGRQLGSPIAELENLVDNSIFAPVTNT